jgi:hypothetical protein
MQQQRSCLNQTRENQKDETTTMNCEISKKKKKKIKIFFFFLFRLFISYLCSCFSLQSEIKVVWLAMVDSVVVKDFWVKRRRPMKTMHLNKYVSSRLNTWLRHAHFETQRRAKKKKKKDLTFFFFFFFFFPRAGQMGRWLNYANDCGRNEACRSRTSGCAVFSVTTNNSHVSHWSAEWRKRPRQRAICRCWWKMARAALTCISMSTIPPAKTSSNRLRKSFGQKTNRHSSSS